MELDLTSINVQELIDANIQVVMVLKDNHRYVGQFLGEELKVNLVPTDNSDKNVQFFKIKHRDQIIYVPKNQVAKMDFSL